MRVIIGGTAPKQVEVQSLVHTLPRTAIRKFMMTRQVFCRKYQKELRLRLCTFSGAKGQELRLYRNRSAGMAKTPNHAHHEKRLNVFEPDAKKFLKSNVRNSSPMMKALRKQKVGLSKNKHLV